MFGILTYVSELKNNVWYFDLRKWTKKTMFGILTYISEPDPDIDF